MMSLIRTAVALVVMLSVEAAFSASHPQVVAVPLSRPGEPISLEIDIPAARIEVIGEDRQDAEFEVTRSGAERKLTTPSGTRTVAGGSYELEVREDDNALLIDIDRPASGVAIVARIPHRADLRLATNGSEILVRDIAGNLQLENTNGPISAINITGSVIAESVSEVITVSFAGLSEPGATALSSLNGDIHLSLPSDAGVELHLDSARGEIESEFEMEVMPSEPSVERTAVPDGVSVRVENDIVATINGGGPVVRVETLNGDIRITKSGDQEGR